MIASTNNRKNRVEKNSDPRINERIREQIRGAVAYYERANPRDLTYRLAELDQEWDIERVLELNFSSVVLAGIALAVIYTHLIPPRVRRRARRLRSRSCGGCQPTAVAAQAELPSPGCYNRQVASITA